MATSSAIQVADLALTWSNTLGGADMSIIDIDLASDRGLETAAILSLFTDRRAEDDDEPPSGDAKDRRGFWADQFSDVENDQFGSRLWLLGRSKNTSEVLRRAEEFAREGLAWMLEDRVVASIDVLVETVVPQLSMAIGLQKPSGDRVSFRFAHAWDHVEVT